MALGTLNEKALVAERRSPAAEPTGTHDDQLSDLVGRSRTADPAPASGPGRGRSTELAERSRGSRSQLAALSRPRPRSCRGSRTQVEAILREHRELEATFEEKTQLGRREAEDIRSQIAPLLEDRVRRHESDAHALRARWSGCGNRSRSRSTISPSACGSRVRELAVSVSSPNLAGAGG